MWIWLMAFIGPFSDFFLAFLPHRFLLSHLCSFTFAFSLSQKQTKRKLKALSFPNLSQPSPRPEYSGVTRPMKVLCFPSVCPPSALLLPLWLKGFVSKLNPDLEAEAHNIGCVCV